MRQLTDAMTVPVTVIHEQILVGFDERAYTDALKRS